MKPLKYCISFLLGGIATQVPFLNRPLLNFVIKDPIQSFKRFKSFKSVKSLPVRLGTVEQLCFVGARLMCAAGVSYVWFKYGYGIGDIAYATRNQLKTSVCKMSNIISTNCKKIFQRIGVVETKIEKLHGDHVSLVNLVKGIDLKISNIEALALFSSKGISLLCQSLLETHIKLYGENPKKEVVNKNGVFFGCRDFV